MKILVAYYLLRTPSFLDMDDIFPSLAFAFRILSSYILFIVGQTMEAMGKILVPKFLSTPKEFDVMEKALEFYNKWNFLNCIA